MPRGQKYFDEYTDMDIPHWKKWCLRHPEEYKTRHKLRDRKKERLKKQLELPVVTKTPEEVAMELEAKRAAARRAHWQRKRKALGIVSRLDR